jgi:hypothetical protein
MQKKTYEQPIIIDIKLPNHNNELENIKKYITQLKQRYKLLNKINNLSLDEYSKLRDLTLNTLELLGDLSIPAFDIQDELHDKYILAYKSSPELAKKLFLDHYERIHAKYDTLKNRCFRLIENIDESIDNIKNKINPNSI